MLFALFKTFFSVPSSSRDNELNSIFIYDDECVRIYKKHKKNPEPEKNTT